MNQLGLGFQFKLRPTHACPRCHMIDKVELVADGFMDGSAHFMCHRCGIGYGVTPTGRTI